MQESGHEVKHKLHKTAFIIVLFLSSIIITKATVFNSVQKISLSVAQTAVASSDLDKDSVPDLIVGGDPIGAEQGKIRVLLGNGNGIFKPPVAYQVGYNPSAFFNAPYVEKIKVDDLDNDGNPDVIVAHNGERNFTNLSNVFVTVLFGEGNGSLRQGNVYTFVSANNGVVVSSIDV